MTKQYTLKLTEKQFKYLSCAFFEFANLFDAENERKFKEIDKKLLEISIEIRKENKS